MKRTVGLVCLAALLGCSGLKAQRMPEEPALEEFLEIPYATIEGVDPERLSLDLYVPEERGKEEALPVVIMIHGGGWAGGDKGMRHVVGAKMPHFVARGAIFASVNYRLSRQVFKKNRVTHPDHVMDCARAVAWIHDHIAEYGGDPDRLHLVGHSAGGHLAALLATNERFLEAAGQSLSILKSCVLLDPAGLDIPRDIELGVGAGLRTMYRTAFGEDEAVLFDASPMDHVEAGKGIPRTLIFYAGERLHNDELAPPFAQKLTECGSPSKAIDTVTLSHREISSLIGTVGDRMTALIDRLQAGEDPTTFPDTLDEVEGAMVTKLDLAYGEDEEQRLDLYLPAGAQHAPVMLYFHGGGWKVGDKSAVGEKAEFFTGKGWIFASANYRLLPEGRHPKNVEDVAAAVAWIHDRIEEEGGDPGKIFLMGHSAGAHLVALVATDGRYLEQAGASLKTIRGVIPLDTQAYDVERLLNLPAGSATYRSVFGEDEAGVRDASPLHHVAPGKGIPPFLICYSRGLGRSVSPERSAQAKAFAAALKAAGVEVSLVDATDRNHGEINRRFGEPDDEKVTGAALRFLDSLLD